MRIAIVIDSLSGGGAEGVVVRLAEGLASRNVQPFLYCLKAPDLDVTSLEERGVTVRAARSFRRDPLLARRLWRWMRQDRIAVVHAHSCAAYVWALPAALIARIPILHVWHGVLGGGASRYARWARALDRWAAAVGIVATTDRSFLAPSVASQALPIPDGLDVPPSAPDDARAQLTQLCHAPGPTVLTIGTVCHEKDPLTLLRAFALLRERVTNAHLIWVGPWRGEDCRAQVERARMELGLADHVTFTGPIDNAARLIPAADVFCLSSKSEALPNVVLEAMAHRAPIVATTVGDIGRLHAPQDPETLLEHGRSGLLAPPADHATLANQIERVLSDPALGRRLGLAAHERYQANYRRRHMVDRYLDLYHRLARQPSTTRREQPSLRRPAVLMVGPPRGTVGGVGTVIDALASGPLRRACRVARFSRPTARLPDENGFARAMRHLQAVRQLTRVLKIVRPAVVHFHTCSFFSFFRDALDACVAKWYGARVVFHLHGGRFLEFYQQRGPLGKWLIRRCARLADRFIVLSQAWVDTLRDIVNSDRLVVLRNAVPVAPDGLPDPEEARACRFLFVGALTERKGVADLLHAVAMLHNSGIPCSVTLIGPCDEQAARIWRAQVRATQIEDVVTFAGPQAHEHVVASMRAADCVVLPSYSEGLPMVLLEAGALGKPVIATDVGGVVDLMTPTEDQFDAGRRSLLAPIVAAGDVPALTREMKRMATDPHWRATVAKRFCAHVRAHYSDEAQARALVAIYADIGVACPWRAAEQTPRAADTPAPVGATP